MINVLRMVCISLREPAIKLFKGIILLAIWIGTVSGVVFLVSMISGENWISIVVSSFGALIVVLSFAAPCCVFAYAKKIEEALEYAKWHGVPYESAWKAVTK